MLKRFIVFLQALAIVVMLGSCASEMTPEPTGANLPNPASVYCEESGGSLEIRTDSEGGEYGTCLFSDGSECEEWAYLRGECPANVESDVTPLATASPKPLPTDLPSPIPVDLMDTLGWSTYTNNDYDFSFRIPTDWIAEEATTTDPLMNGHLVNFHPQDESNNVNLRVTFRRLREDVLLWPTGVGAGDLVQQDTLDVAGAPVQRILFICPTGQVNAIYYQGQDEANVSRASLEFGFILSFTGVYCEEGTSLGGEIQHVAETILASLDVGE